jgi:D-arabinose 1-dehydrogenase-like Zn-dependent alcohol dehydrogenase
MLSYQVTEFGKPLAQVLRETPTPQGSEVLLQVGHCGVCHSDIHLGDGYFDLGGGNKIDLTSSMRLPRTMGHEIEGTVVAVGPDAQGVKVGDRRIVYPWVGCGNCSPCQRGSEELCVAARALGVQREGGFADHVMVPHARYLFDYGHLAPEQACTYGCSGVTAYGALKKVAPLGAGDTLVIIGAGGVGLAGVRLGRHLFPKTPIVVVELDQSKWELARAAGANECIDPTAEGALKGLLKATGGAAAAIDFVGASSTFNFGLNCLRKGGKLVCVGLFGGGVALSPAMITMKAVSITGSYVGSLEEMAELMVIARGGSLPAPLVNTAPLAHVNTVLDDLRAGRIKGRTILTP